MILDCTRTRKRAFRGVSPHNPPVPRLRQDWRQLNTEAVPYGATPTSPYWPFHEYNLQRQSGNSILSAVMSGKCRLKALCSMATLPRVRTDSSLGMVVLIRVTLLKSLFNRSIQLVVYIIDCISGA